MTASTGRASAAAQSAENKPLDLARVLPSNVFTTYRRGSRRCAPFLRAKLAARAHSAYINARILIAIRAMPLSFAAGDDGKQITGAQIRMARAYLRWTISDLAEHAGIAKTTIHRIEQIDGIPDISGGPELTRAARAAARVRSVGAISKAFTAAGVRFLPASSVVRANGYPVIASGDGRIFKIEGQGERWQAIADKATAYIQAASGLSPDDLAELIGGLTALRARMRAADAPEPKGG